MKNRATFAGIFMTALGIASGCAVDSGNEADEGGVTTNQQTPPFIIEASERYLSHTFGDWSNYADAVVLAEVVSEQRIEPAADETSPQRYPVGRTIAIDVAEVYWQRGGLAAPRQFEMKAWGWMTLETGEERPSVGERASRLEVGHRYLLALDEAGTDAKDELWTVLGSGASLPADSVMGVGEHEAQIVREPPERNSDSGQVAEAVAGLEPDAAGALIAKRIDGLTQSARRG